MSKKGNPTQVITITRSGNTVLANMTDVHASGEVNGVAGIARCHPNDTFDFYEGTRIALARAFGKDPFPKTEEEETSGKTPQFSDGKWVKARFGNCGKRGDWIRIDVPWKTDGLYKTGETLQIDTPDADGMGCWVRFSKANRLKFIANSEYSIWTPNKSKAKPSEDLDSEAAPLVPDFKVGDIVKTGEHPFAKRCQNCTARVDSVEVGSSDIAYNVLVRTADKQIILQTCSQFRDHPAPLTLLWREEK